MSQTLRTLEDLETLVSREAQAEGPAALAAVQAERERFRLARELSGLRKASGMTQVQLSQKSGVHQSEISKVESASINASQATYAKLFFALGHELKPVRLSARTSSPRVAKSRTRRGTT